MRRRTILVVAAIAALAVAVAAVLHEDTTFGSDDAAGVIRDFDHRGAVRDIRCEPAGDGHWACTYRLNGELCRASVGSGEHPGMASIC